MHGVPVSRSLGNGPQGSPARRSALRHVMALAAAGLALASALAADSSPPGGSTAPGSTTPTSSTPPVTGVPTGTPTGGQTGIAPTNVVSIGHVGSMDGRTIGIHFEEELDPTNASIATNYLVNHGLVRVTNVTVRPDRHSVALQVDTPLRGAFTVWAAIQDVTGAGIILPGVTNVVLGFATGEVGPVLRPGSNFTSDNATFEIVGGGSGVGGTADEFYVAEKTAGGNFDVRVRVTALRGPDAACSAGLFARAGTNSGSRGLALSLGAPPPGDNRMLARLRTAASSPALQLGSVTPSSIPNGWMRLQREGDVFTSYCSLDGREWLQIARTNQAFGPVMHVGLGVTANSASLLATGTFTHFQLRSQIALEAERGPAGQDLVFSFNTERGVAYELQMTTNLAGAAWVPLTNFTGDGWRYSVTNTSPTGPARYYRAVMPEP